MEAESNEGRAKIATKVAAITGEIKGLTKDGRNTYQNYDYISIEEMTRVLGPLLAKHNLAIVPAISEVIQTEGQTAKGATQIQTLVNCEFALVCGDTGAAVTVRWVGEGFDTQDKGVNKAVRSGFKYFLMTLFLATAGDEQETDAGPGPEPQQKRQQPKPQAVAETRPSGGQPASPDAVLSVLRGRGGWIETPTEFLRDAGENAQPIKRETQQHVQATLAMAVAFDGATDQDIAESAKCLVRWLYGVDKTDQLTESEGQAIKYAWSTPQGTLNEYAQQEATNCLSVAIEEAQ